MLAQSINFSKWTNITARILLRSDIHVLFFLTRDISTLSWLLLYLIISTLWKCCIKRSGVSFFWEGETKEFFKGSRGSWSARRRDLTDEVTTKEGEGGKKFLRTGNFFQLRPIFSRWFIYKWFTLGRLGRRYYRIGLCIFPCRRTNIKWAIWRLVKRQSANVREDILDSVKQGGKGARAV